MLTAVAATPSELAGLRREADSLAGCGEWNAAITEYLRYLCFDSLQTEDSAAAQVCEQLALCYLNTGQDVKGLRYFALSLEQVQSPSARDARKLRQAVAQATGGQLDKAEFAFRRMAETSRNPDVRAQALLLAAGLSVYRQEWQTARDILNGFRAQSPEALAADGEQIDSLLVSAAKLRLRSPRKAKWLSVLLPGLGQTYGGDVTDGVNGFVLAGGFAFLTARVIYLGEFFDAFPAALGFYKFYSGNLSNAGADARAGNLRRAARKRDEILALMQALWNTRWPGP